MVTKQNCWMIFWKTTSITCLVILNVNIDFERELANGTFAIIQSINLNRQGQVDSITVTINHFGEPLKLMRCTIQDKYIFIEMFYK
jgi:hypothetical protein